MIGIRLFLTIAVSIFWMTGCTEGRNKQAQATPRVAPVVKAARQTLGTNFEIAAEFRPYQEVDMFAKVSGYVKKLYINWGSHVKQGQLLAILEVPELEHQLQRDRAMVRRGSHEVTRYKQELQRSESAYRVAHLTYTRLADVQKSQANLVAQQEIDVAEGKDLEADANLSAARAALQVADENLLDAEAALEQDEALYAYSEIRAPFDGVVTRLDAYSGALLSSATSSDKSATALCHVSQNNLLRLVIPLPQRVLGDVRVGQFVDVQVAALGKTLRGKIALFTDQVDFATRTMHTEVTVPNPTYELVPGMSASVKIPLRQAENVITLPVEAVQASTEEEGAVLIVNGENRLEQRRVTLGIQTNTHFEIKSGVRENELVIFGSQAQYRPGEVVTPREVNPRD